MVGVLLLFSIGVVCFYYFECGLVVVGLLMMVDFLCLGLVIVDFGYIVVYELMVLWELLIVIYFLSL